MCTLSGEHVHTHTSACARPELWKSSLSLFQVLTNVGILYCFRTESCHVMSCHVTDRRNQRRESARLVYLVTSSRGLAPRALTAAGPSKHTGTRNIGSINTGTVGGFSLSTCTVQLSMCTLSGEHVHTYTSAWGARFQVSMCTCTHQHVHASG